jgi:hypothetical protein
MHLLRSDGTSTGIVPASRPLELFAPYGNDFLVGEQSNDNVSAIAAMYPNGSLTTLHTVSDPSTFGGATAAVDGHVFAWVEGPDQSSICANGVGSGTVFVQQGTAAPKAIVHLPQSGDAVWTLGGFSGDRIWLTQSTGCPANPGYVTQAFAVSSTGGSLTSVQSQLGAGCTLTAMALDGSMLCTTNVSSPHGAWRYISAAGATRDFSVASLGSPCTGLGPLHDFEGFALSLDGRYLSVDAGCVGASRVDRLFIITTASATVTPANTAAYLAADSFLPDDDVLCNNLSDPNQSSAYVVTPSGAASQLAAGEATWAGNSVVW